MAMGTHALETAPRDKHPSISAPVAPRTFAEQIRTAPWSTQIRRYGERHRVKAWMTDWAQVHGLRGQTSIADRAEWDNYYIENWSLALDLKILALTVPAVLRRAR